MTYENVEQTASLVSGSFVPAMRASGSFEVGDAYEVLLGKHCEAF